MKFEFFGFLFFIWDMLVSKVALSQPQNYPSVQRLIVTTISSISPNTLTVQRILKWCLKHKQVLVKIQRKLWLSVQKKRLLNVWALLCVLHHIAHPHISLQSPHCNYGVFVSSIVKPVQRVQPNKSWLNCKMESKVDVFFVCPSVISFSCGVITRQLPFWCRVIGV